MQDNFKQRKDSILSKKDKSSKQSWDEHILDLCESLNELEEYYTTSSCSGRVVLMIDQERKEEGLFVSVSHDIIDIDWLNEGVSKSKGNVKFKVDPCILHVACKTLKDASELYDKAKLAGWKRSGLISFDGKFVLELNSTEKLEFPIVSNGKSLVNGDFLKKIVEESNSKLKKSWKKIGDLKNSLK